MISIIDLDTVIIDGQSQDLVAAIANNLQGDLPGILKALKDWDSDRAAKSEAEQLAKVEQAHRLEVEQLRMEISDRDTTIANLKLETAPDLQAIAQGLRDAGLSAWADRAVTVADASKGVLQMVIDLYTVANEPRSLDQCDRVKALFMAIAHATSDDEAARIWPTLEEGAAMNALLDAAGVGPKWLRFRDA